ncbi:hypothetical protein ACSBR2_017082 [Camellia fascicularis]
MAVRQRAVATLPTLMRALRKGTTSPNPKLPNQQPLPSLRRAFSLYNQINLIDNVPEDQLRFQGYTDEGVHSEWGCLRRVHARVMYEACAVVVVTFGNVNPSKKLKNDFTFANMSSVMKTFAHSTICAFSPFFRLPPNVAMKILRRN